MQHGAELAARQLILFAVRTNQRAAVDIQLPAVELIAFHLTALFVRHRQIHGARQQIARADGQLTRVERFGDVIVRADLQTKDFVHFIITTGQEHQRHVCLLAQLARQQQAVFTGQVDIHDYQVDVVFGQYLMHFSAVGCLIHDITFCLKNALEGVTRDQFVFNDKNVWGLHVSLPKICQQIENGAYAGIQAG